MRQKKLSALSPDNTGLPRRNCEVSFAGDELVIGVPGLGDGPIELYGILPSGKKGFSMEIQPDQEGSYSTQNLLGALQGIFDPQGNGKDFSLALRCPGEEFLLSIETGKNKSPLAPWLGLSKGESPLFHAPDTSKSQIEEVLPWMQEEEEKPFYPCVYYTPEGLWHLTCASQRGAILHSEGVRLGRFSLFGKKLRLSLTGTRGILDGEAVLTYQTSNPEKVAQLPMTLTPAGEKEGSFTLKATLPLKDALLKRGTWLPALTVRAGEEEVTLPIAMSYPQRLFYNYLYKGRYRRRSRIFFPSNLDTGALSIQYRPIEKTDRLPFHLKELFALLSYLVRKGSYDKKNVQLVFEKNSQMAQENGFYYFKHCMDNGEEERMGAEIYYVVQENSKDMTRLEPYMDHVLIYKSLRHMKYLLSAKLLITTDTRYHVYPKRSRGSLLMHSLRKKPVVFLQHGVTALKKVDAYYGKGTQGACSLFVATSDREKKLVKEHFGYKDSEILTAGFARWDALTDKSQDSREILIMPSWRSYLANIGPGEFYQSAYYRNYMSLLNSSRLAKLLEEQDLTLNFYLHSKFRRYIHSFASISDRVRLIPFGEEEANELIMRCKLLITDYSSVCWDVLYQNKPVIFFQFDRYDYLTVHGSYLSMPQELPGECVYTASDVVELLHTYADNGLKLKEAHVPLVEEFLPRRDTENSRRICDAICEKWPQGSGKGGAK